MNKYLEKLAARAVSPKTELEPGVMWNHNKKVVELTKVKMEEEMDRADTRQRAITSGVYSGLGGLVGGIYGMENEHRLDFGPRYETEIFDEEPYLRKRLVSKGTPKLQSFVDKFGGPRKVSGIIHAVGGAALIGGLGYAIGGVQPHERKWRKDDFQGKYENKYEQKINEIEGWD
jgi:hypothetical protein